MTYYDQLLDSGTPVWMGTVEQGEIMFVPSGYVHGIRAPQSRARIAPSEMVGISVPVVADPELCVSQVVAHGPQHRRLHCHYAKLRQRE